ncbi:DUF2656 family protein [Synechococcus sp. HK01-R]|jgi:hypothetical protein|uniref:DUF2656 family protein n=1 Tax=Synechococcus sp. HK01-R TaxID=2751171 RepID=UPI001624326D|nr:DUF2656 family protein [Synechococcus sp. HK01-R]QNG27204.1 DUF2656 family protein [Synechococcus sp. HK01-R]
MTCFVLSHNLQVNSPSLPPLGAQELANGLKQYSQRISSAAPLDHPHWLVTVDAEGSASEVADDLVSAWRAFRAARGDDAGHHLLALGGRKDTAGAPGSPLQLGAWGVDVVETLDGDAFLQAINWEGLKAGRPADGVFERRG